MPPIRPPPNRRRSFRRQPRHPTSTLPPSALRPAPSSSSGSTKQTSPPAGRYSRSQARSTTSGSDSLRTITSTSRRHHRQSPPPLPARCRLSTSKTASGTPSAIWGTSGTSTRARTSHSGCARRRPRHRVSTSWPAAVFGVETDDVPSAVALLAAQTNLDTLSRPALKEEARTPAATMSGGQWLPSAHTIIATPGTTPVPADEQLWSGNRKSHSMLFTTSSSCL